MSLSKWSIIPWMGHQLHNPAGTKMPSQTRRTTVNPKSARRRYRRTILLLGCFFVACITVPRLRADELHPDLKRAIADWQRRLLGITTIIYEAEGTVLIPKGATSEEIKSELEDFKQLNPAWANGDFPPDDYRYQALVKYEMNLERTLIRKENGRQTCDPRKRTFVPRLEISLCNGQDIEKYLPRAKNSLSKHDIELQKLTPNYAGLFLESRDRPILIGTGILGKRGEGFSQKVGMREPLEENALRVHGRGDRAGKPHVVLRTTSPGGTRGFDEYWIDPSQDSAITAWTHFDDEGLVTKASEIEYQQAAGFWLPKKWTWTSLSDGRITTSEKFEMKTLAVNVPLSEDRFQVAITPEMNVFDFRTGREYPAGNPEIDLRELRKEEAVQMRNGRNWLPGWFWWATVVIATGGTGLLLIRRHYRGGK